MLQTQTTEKVILQIIKINETMIAIRMRNFIELWDLVNFMCFKQILANDSTLLNLIKLNSNQLLSSHNDGTIEIWDLFDNNCKNLYNTIPHQCKYTI